MSVSKQLIYPFIRTDEVAVFVFHLNLQRLTKSEVVVNPDHDPIQKSQNVFGSRTVLVELNTQDILCGRHTSGSFLKAERTDDNPPFCSGVADFVG